MNILKPVLPGLVIILTQWAASAQPDTARITEKALFFADSLIKADGYQNWNTYADLAPASVIKYYGGKEGLIEHIVNGKKRLVSTTDEDLPVLKMMNLMTLNDQWQCVIRESRYIHRDDKKYHLITYFIGQSKDEGETWRLFDVYYNKIANVIYMLPDIFGDLPIPETALLSQEEELAQIQAQEAAAKKASAGKQTSSAANGKRTASKKK
ncbi:hypothetical protein ACX0G9_20065 [Flavitalea flava]